MPRVNVYLPENLEQGVRQLRLPISAICQAALTRATAEVAEYRALPFGPNGLLPLTEKARAAIRAASYATRGRPITSTDLLREFTQQEGVVTTAIVSLGVSPDDIAVGLPETGEEHDPFQESTRPYSPSGHELLRTAADEAAGVGHDYLAPEHFLLALASSAQDWAKSSREAISVDGGTLRRAVQDAMMSRPGTSARPGSTSPQMAQQLSDLRQRVEQLEQRLA